MANFKIGDRIKITIYEDTGKTGIIVDKADEPYRDVIRSVRQPKDKIVRYWWKVKLDETGETKDFPDNILVRFE